MFSRVELDVDPELLKAEKLRYRELAECLSRRNVGCLRNFYTTKWGRAASEPYPMVGFEEAMRRRTLLATLILERDLIRRRGYHKNLTVAIFGAGGTGKTTYSVVSGVQALVSAGYPVGDAVRMAANLTLFDPEETIGFLELVIRNRLWVPFIIIDDVGAQISKYWIFLKKLYWANFFSILDHVKDWCGVLIMTAKQEGRAPAGMRDIMDMVVIARDVDVPFDGKTYTMVIMEYYSAVERRRRLAYVDVVPWLRMPDEIWKPMLETRARMGEERIEEIKKSLLRERPGGNGEDGRGTEEGEASTR